MKKGALGRVILIVIASCITFSCNQSKSLQELLQEERKAIDKFISMNDLVILKNYPKDGVFKENEYYRTDDGLFFQVVDSGNGIRAQLLDDVSVRFDYFQFVKDAASGDTTKYGFPFTSTYYSTGVLISSNGQPYSFVYGISQTYSSSYSPACQSWVIPLTYVGEGAVLNMIIPSTLGAYNDYNNVTPVFYKNLKYTRFN